MQITIIPCLTDNYAYVIHDKNSNTTGVVDPSESKPIIYYLKEKNLKLNYILNTHHHFDHIGGNEELKKIYNAKVVGFKGDKHRIPGKEKIVFTGDTLFSLGCGRIFEGDYKQMLNSLNTIKELPRDTKIYCGHEYTYKNAEFCIKYDSNNIDLKKKFEKIKKKHSQNLPTIPSSLEEELKSNIFLRCDKNELKIRLNMQNQQDLEVFKKVRDLKDNF